jgi:hypothetical protein
MIMSGSSRGSLVVSLNFFLVDFFMFMDENKGFFFFFPQFCGFKSLVITFIVLKFSENNCSKKNEIFQIFTSKNSPQNMWVGQVSNKH